MNGEKTVLHNGQNSFNTDNSRTSQGSITGLSNNSPRDVDYSRTRTSTRQVSEFNEDYLPGEDLKSREVSTLVPYTDNSTKLQNLQEVSAQRGPGFLERMNQSTDLLELSNLRGKEKIAELLEKIKTHSSRIRVSLKELEEKHEALEEGQDLMHQSRYSLQSEVLNRLEKINQSCDEAKEKVNANLQLAQIQTSNEFDRETTIEKLKIMHNNFKEVADVEILGFQNITNNMTTLNTEKELINQTVALIDKPDQV